MAITLLTVLIGQFAPAARATALAIQACMLDLGASGGAWLSVRLSWPELCSLIAAAVAAGALLVAVAVRTQRLAGRGAGGSAVTTNAAPLPTGVP